MHSAYKIILLIFLSFILLKAANFRDDCEPNSTAISSNQIPSTSSFAGKSARRSFSEYLQLLVLAETCNNNKLHRELGTLYRELDVTFAKYNKEVPINVRSSIENYEKAENRKHLAHAICEEYKNKYFSCFMQRKKILDDFISFVITNLDYNSTNPEIISLIELASIEDRLEREQKIREAIINFDLHSLDNSSEFDDFIQLIQKYRYINEQIANSEAELNAAVSNFSDILLECSDFFHDIYYNNCGNNNFFSSYYDALFYDENKANREENQNRAKLKIYRDLYRDFLNAQDKLKNHQRNYQDITNLKACCKEIKKCIEEQQLSAVKKPVDFIAPNPSNTGIRFYLGLIKSLIQPANIRKFVNSQAARS